MAANQHSQKLCCHWVQLAAEYLAWCPVHGEAAFRTLLRSVPVGGDDQRLPRRAVRLAQDHGLHDIAAGGCS